MAELKASKQGLKQIKQARDKKGWIVEDPRWLFEASKILDPKRDWQAEEGIYANGVSSGTWKAFLYNTRKKGISTEVFKVFCKVLDISWEDVIEQTIENPHGSLQVNEANHLAECFSKAVQQLGSTDDYVRLSGIYDLEQILKDAEDGYYWKVIEILTLYVRQRSPWNKEKEAEAKTEQNIPPLPDDVQKVMTVLAQRKYTYGHHLEPHPLDLHGADLRRLQLPPKSKLNQLNFAKANLAGTNLQEASLQEVNLQEANLEEANLQKAYLWGVNLQEAYLRKADLQRARLESAKLQKAGLVGAQLQRVNLQEAELQGAFLGGADLQEAFLFKADLQGADLRLTKLQGASLIEANLQGAELYGADLQNVKFDNANLKGANLELANLYGASGLNLKQVQEATSYEAAARLPDNLQP